MRSVRVGLCGSVGVFLLAACAADATQRITEEREEVTSELTTPTGAELVILPRPAARVTKVFADAWVAPFGGSGATTAIVTSPKTEGTSALSVTLGAAATSLAMTVNNAEAQLAGNGQTELSFSFNAGSTVHAGVASLQIAVEDDDAATSTTWVALKPYLTTGTVAANTWYSVSIPLSVLNPSGAHIRRLLVGKSTAAGAKFVLDNVRFSWTDASPTETLVYGDAPGASFIIDGWDSTTATNTFRTTGTNGRKATYTAAWSAVSFTRDWSLAAYPAGTHTTVSFDISGGSGAVPAAMSSMLLGLDGDPVVPLTNYIPGGLKANTWHRVTIPVSALVSGAYRQVTFKDESTAVYSFYVDNIRFQVDHAPPALRAPFTPPPNPTVEPAVFGPTTCTAVVRRDRTISTKATDQYEWKDRACALRTASMVRSDAKGGHAIELSYKFGAAQRTIGVSPEDGAGGFGYVVSHLSDPDIAYRNGADDSPLGSSLASTYQTLFQGSHHAVHRFTMNYPRWGVAGGVDVKYNMPVTIDWLYRTGTDAPVYAITFDLSAAPANAVSADMRAPYGAMNFDGTAANQWGDAIGGVAWADAYKFSSLGNGLTLNSAWTWNEPNTGPAYNALWTKTVDAELGAVATHVIQKMDAGGYSHGTVGRGTTSAAGFKCTADDGLNNLMHTMPCASNWSFQSVQWAFWDDNGNPTATQQTGAKRLAWGSDWGTLGQANVTTVNGNAVKGHAKVSYSTFIVMDAHTKTPTFSTAAQIPVVNGTLLTATAGAVRVSGPAGANRTDTQPYTPAGYSPVYNTWEVDASAAGGASLGIDVGGTSWLENPTFVVHNYTRSTAPVGVTLDGAALTADQAYFASVRPGSQELWLTLNAKLKGANHKLVIP